MIDGNAKGRNLDALAIPNGRGPRGEQQFRSCLDSEDGFCISEVDHRADVTTIRINPAALLAEVHLVAGEIA